MAGRPRTKALQKKTAEKARKRQDKRFEKEDAARQRATRKRVRADKAERREEGQRKNADAVWNLPENRYGNGRLKKEAQLALLRALRHEIVFNRKSIENAAFDLGIPFGRAAYYCSKYKWHEARIREEELEFGLAGSANIADHAVQRQEKAINRLARLEKIADGFEHLLVTKLQLAVSSEQEIDVIDKVTGACIRKRAPIINEQDLARLVAMWGQYQKLVKELNALHDAPLKNDLNRLREVHRRLEAKLNMKRAELATFQLPPVPEDYDADD